MDVIMGDADKGGQKRHGIFTQLRAAWTGLFRTTGDPLSYSSSSSNPSAVHPSREISLHSGKAAHAEQLTKAGKMPVHDHGGQLDLKSAIVDGSFWSMPEPQLLELVAKEFPTELERLQNATFVANPDATHPAGPSISESLFDRDYAEVNRTLVGMLALRWLRNNQYDILTAGQGSAVRLKRESFAWLRDNFTRGLKCSEDVYTLVVSTVINDLGKDPNLAKDYAQLEGVDISKVNHDMILYRAVEAGMVPALNRLTKENKQQVLRGIKLGSNFNFGQLAQAENAPASLAGLAEMRGHDRAFEMRFMEQVLDLAGASGHEDWTCAKKLIDPICQSYRNVYDVAHAIMDEKMSLREGYDIILTRKLDLLRRTGYSRPFDIQNRRDRALMRLFCLGNTANGHEAELYTAAFTERISEETRRILVHGLNLDGTVEEPATQATYLPAMFTKAAGNTASGSVDEKIATISAVLRYLSRCLVVHPDSLERLPKGVTVVERDVRGVIPVLDSAEFRRNPDILDEENVPEDHVANMALGY